MVKLPDRYTTPIGLFVLIDRMVIIIEWSRILARFENYSELGVKKAPP